jgi:hypothetical protein
MSKRNKLALLIPIGTFILGIFVQVLFDQFLSSRSLMPLTTAVILLSLVIILIWLRQAETRFDSIDNQLINLIDLAGLNGKFIEDGAKGESYLLSTELIEKAQTSILYVSSWEPFDIYQANDTDIMIGDSDIVKARREFYHTLIRQVERHKDDITPFHRRIVQTPKEYEGKTLPYYLDQIFYYYLENMARIQAQSPSSCTIKRVTSRINLHFIVIDNKYIIIPILTHEKKVLQARHGAMFLEDTTKDRKLANCLIHIYWTLDPDAEPIKMADIAH